MGGRKFILALLAIGVGTTIELYTSRGLSATMAGLLGTLVAAFSAANYAVTKKHFEHKRTTEKYVEHRSGHDLDMDQIIRLIQNRNESDTQVVGQLVDALSGLKEEVTEVKKATSQVGQSMVNVAKVVSQRRE